MVSWIPDWSVICGLVALITLAILVLLDMVARAFSLQPLSMWVKGEYAQLAVSFLLIAFAFSMVKAGDAVASEITATVAAATGNYDLNKQVKDDLGNPFKIAKGYITDTLIKCESNMYLKLYMWNIPVAYLQSISFDFVGIESPAGGYAFSGISTTFQYVNNAIVQIALFNFVTYYFLTFCQYSMLQVFLPIGLILRAFPITRGAGGLITAFSLGFAFVFPISYLFVVAVMPVSGKACEKVDYTPQVPCFTNEGQIKENEYAIKSEKNELAKARDGAMGGMSLMYVQAFFFPLVSLILVFTFVRQTASLFGADLAEIGRGLVKII